ncbi:MAG TPA: endolytic transglycosylase MltG [Firmicutes bacterium]|nr:endolytic transglycosylase MltG [Bacillota bacterium]
MWKHVVTQNINRFLPGFKAFRTFLRSSLYRVFRPVFKDRSRLQFIIKPLFWIGLIFFLGQALWIYSGIQTNKTVISSHNIMVEIPMGSSVFQISRLLEEKGLIINRDSFVWYLYLTGKKDSLKAGHYTFSPNVSFKQLLRELQKGRPVIYKVTIPEGYTTEEIGRLLGSKGLIKLDRFQELLHDKVFLNSHLVEFSPLTGEGFLFPDTYEFVKGASEEEILAIFLHRFRQVWSEIASDMVTTGLSPIELVTLASIVEGEAKVEDERPIIAGVFLNRLRKGLLLQSCATVQYALGERKQRLLYKDLQIDSPYNTYRYKGFPPTPIGNPGRASLAAVLQPMKTDYLYFFAKSDGSHIFSRTYREHLKAQSLMANQR